MSKVSQEAATSFSQRLAQWGESLPSEEQEVLQALLQRATERYQELRQTRADELGALDDEESLLVQAADAAIVEAGVDQLPVPMTTAWTVTTVTTTIQTSRWLCSKKTPPKR